MDLVYPGSHNPLTLTREHLATFTCHYDLYNYPFNTHQCFLIFRFPSTYRGFVHFDTEKYITFTGPQELSKYSVTHVGPGQDLGKDTELQVCVRLELQCHGAGLVLSFFVPSVLLLLMGWASFFVAWEAMLVRVVLSIGILILSYTLRLVLLTASVPVNPSIRLIDIWYCFFVVTMSVNVLVHVLIRQRSTYDEAPKTKPLFVRPAGGGGVVIGREKNEERATYPRLVVIYRSLVLPGILVVFNIIFWLLLLAR